MSGDYGTVSMDSVSVTDSFSVVLKPVVKAKGDSSGGSSDPEVEQRRPQRVVFVDEHTALTQRQRDVSQAKGDSNGISDQQHRPRRVVFVDEHTVLTQRQQRDIDPTQGPLPMATNREGLPLLNKISLSNSTRSTLPRSSDGEDDLFDKTGPATSNPMDRPYSPAPNSHSGSISESAQYQQIRGTQLPSKDYDSLDYDVCYNVPYKNMIRKYTGRTYIHMELMRWTLVGIIGLCTGIVAAFIDICVKELFKAKFSVFETVFSATIEDGTVIYTFLVLVGFNLIFALIAGILIALEPVAAGSGIPEIKCYLNGVKVPHVTRVGTLIAKAVGVLFSVAGGFFVGKEGPMIHSGAIIGAGIPQFRSLFYKKFKLPYPFFRSDRDKRDFVSSGAAAGVAAAFGAPIGGVLFSLEEGSSFWNQSLTWKTLFCCFSATFILNMILTVYTGGDIGFLNLGAPGLVDFGVFSKDKHLWNAYHLIIFIAMGAVGGLLGALFNELNINLTIYRMKYLNKRGQSKLWKIMEVMLIGLVTTAGVFTCSMLLGTCLHETNQSTSSSTTSIDNIILQGDQSFVNETRNFFCPGYSNFKENRAYYNDMATLMFNSQEMAIKQLFHQSGAFTLPTLGIFFMLLFFVACWTYGAGIPSGLFIPCLAIGAAYGRFVATVFGYLHSAAPSVFYVLTNISSGTYALIGAAAFLGGVVRMTISLTVILIESTNEISFGLPIMLTLLVAKWVGDLFNEGIYDKHIELKGTPLLGWESPQRMERLSAEDVMNSNRLYYLFPITRVRSIVRMLRTTAHSGFLVVSHAKVGKPLQQQRILPRKHRPQLYTRPSVLGYYDTDIDTDLDSRRSPVFSSAESTRVDSDFSGTFTLPQYNDPIAEAKPLLLRGIITRSQLVVLLKNKIFYNESDGPKSQPEIDHTTMIKEYPRYPSIFNVDVSETEQQMLMDISLYMNPCPYTISRETPLPQVFNLFRTMGLRHLPVVEESGLLAGIITRHDLTHESLHAKRHEKKHREKATNEQPQRQLHINEYQSLPA